MLSGDSGHGESICTPRSVSKRLFGQGASSSKRSLFAGQESSSSTRVSKDTAQASGGEESDLGPMSPLALTDDSASSYENSPRRYFTSPFTSPVKSPSNLHNVGTISWDRLRPNLSRDKSENHISPFNALKSLTRAARSSPNKKIPPIKDLPKSLPTTPKGKEQRGYSPSAYDSIEREMATLFNETDIVPETPCRRTKSQTNDTGHDCYHDNHDDDNDRIEETPRKLNERVEKQRLVTPLSCVQKKDMIVPPLHRRKSLCSFDTNDEQSCSPEIDKSFACLKRHATVAPDSPPLVGVKISKIDDISMLIPKARASLFRETINDLTLNVKSFYKSTGKRARSVGGRGGDDDDDDDDDDGGGGGGGGGSSSHVISVPIKSSIIPMRKKRYSLPAHMTNNNYHKRGPKRVSVSGKNTFMEMNAGVRHGIKRPKIKRHVSRVEAFQTANQKSKIMDHGNKDDNVNNDKSCDYFNEKKMIVDNESESSSTISTSIPSVNTSAECYFSSLSIDRDPPSSSIANSNKRFFKTNRTLKSHNVVATVTVNNKIKLKVSDGKIALNKKHSQITRNPRKRARLEEMSFDTTDLTVDEPNFDTSMEKKNVVDGILKVLEDDWADDEYDTMETLTTSFISPSRCPKTFPNTPANSVTMSPASVLSNMTLSMNIKDSTTTTTTSSSGSAMKTLDDTNTSMKFYPLFTKGYSSSIIDENFTMHSLMGSEKKNQRGLKRSWQTSAKAGGAENQYQIDAGQKRFGATTCDECGILYQLGEPEDENAHLNYHNNIKILKFNGWKNERVIVTDPLTNSRIIGIEPGDSKQCWKKVEQVLAVVDKDLGLADMELSSYLDKKIYFYVREKRIVGVMVVESIESAHRMIPEFAELNCCSAENTPAKCGINVIWTAMSHRKKHIATKLLDSLRSTYYFGYIMSLDDIAFSIPTPSGKIFAEKYTKTRNFKVYN